MCPIIATVIKLDIVVINTEGFEKSIRKPFKCFFRVERRGDIYIMSFSVKQNLCSQES